MRVASGDVFTAERTVVLELSPLVEASLVEGVSASEFVDLGI